VQPVIVRSQPVILPSALRHGDAVALVSPSGPVAPHRVAAAIMVLTSWGLRPQVFPHALERAGYMAGSDDQRLADLNQALADPLMRAVWCTRGGYGLQRIVDGVDYAAAAADPKLVVGFSDITALLLALWQRIGLVTVHGPVAAQMDKGGDSITAQGAKHALMSSQPVTVKADPAELTYSVRTPGRAQGRLLGGNLSLLASSAGTADLPDLTGAILLIEEVGEVPYRVDRMLTQLMRCGALAGLAGVAIGQFTECGEVAEVIGERLSRLGIPMLGGLPIGHGDQHVAVPLGTLSTLDADAGTLIVAPATRAGAD
jgi:muramoyltetrapeptide carboxypeptidase